MSEWQPIETAPKDGTQFLGGTLGSEYRYCVAWDEYREKFAISGAADWYYTPTHWQPLPKPPDVDPYKGTPLEGLGDAICEGPPETEPTCPLTAMTDDQRMEIFSRYCLSCGSKNPSCQCWNDE